MILEIPNELKALDQWVVVNWGSKVPVNARTGLAASSSDPSTWTDFQTCLLCVEQGEAHDLGFVFDDNGYVGIDIDAGWDEDGFLSPISCDILGVCQSYTERSRSGRGFHVILKGDLPFKGRNNQAGVEIYKDARYFITTGNVFLYPDLIANQKAIDYVVERYFPETVREKEGKRGFRRVYTPQWEMPCGDRIKLRPSYPKITKGSRNLCLTSLAGMLHSQGYDSCHIYDELCYANMTACDPELDDYEIEAIVRSVTRYTR